MTDSFSFLFHNPLSNKCSIHLHLFRILASPWLVLSTSPFLFIFYFEWKVDEAHKMGKNNIRYIRLRHQLTYPITTQNNAFVTCWLEIFFGYLASVPKLSWCVALAGTITLLSLYYYYYLASAACIFKFNRFTTFNTLIIWEVYLCNCLVTALPWD